MLPKGFYVIAGISILLTIVLFIALAFMSLLPRAAHIPSP